MQNNNTNNQITPMTSAQGVQNSMAVQGAQTQNIQSAQTQGAGQAMQNQGTQGQMPGVQRVHQQVEELRQTLQDLMMNKQYADGEIVSASADLDLQLQNYSRMLNDKKQPSMRTF